jgi:hypothetical protein
MKTFTWLDTTDTKLFRGIAVTKFRYDPAFYIHGFDRNVYAVAPSFAAVANDGYDYGLPEFGFILEAAAPRRLQGMGVAHRVLEELPTTRKTRRPSEPALVAVHFDVEPDNEMALLFSVRPTTTSVSRLVVVGYREPAFMGDYTLFYDGDEIFVYETPVFNAWQRVLDSFDFSIPPQENEVG